MAESCRHEVTVPKGNGEVACTSCHVRLPEHWNCTDCDWKWRDGLGGPYRTWENPCGRHA